MGNVDAAGRPFGFAVDILLEAARRDGVTIEWVQGISGDRNEAGLRTGRIDLIATGVDTPERRREFYVSEPWWTLDIAALVPSSGILRRESELAGRRLAVSTVGRALVAEHFPGSRLDLLPTATDAANAVCRGDAEAAVFASVYVREILALAPEPCRGVGLRLVDTTLHRDAVFVARQGAASAARALRWRVTELTMDGTLIAIASRYPAISTPQARQLTGLLHARYQRRTWQLVASAVALLALVSCVFAVWLQKSRVRLRAANAGLEAANGEKSLLLREVQHRVKNNLQVVSSLLGLQAAEATAAPAKTALLEMRNRVRSMAEIHEKLCYSGTAAAIEFGPYLQGLALTLMQSYAVDPDRIRIGVEGDVALHLDESVPCGLIANELISNMFKHAFPSGRDGEIRIRLQSHDDTVQLEFSDNGIGLPPGFTIEGSSSLGLTVVADLAEQLRGRLECSSGHGATFRLVFRRSRV